MAKFDHPISAESLDRQAPHHNAERLFHETFGCTANAQFFERQSNCPGVKDLPHLEIVGAEHSIDPWEQPPGLALFAGLPELPGEPGAENPLPSSLMHSLSPLPMDNSLYPQVAPPEAQLGLPMNSLISAAEQLELDRQLREMNDGFNNWRRGL